MATTDLKFWDGSAWVSVGSVAGDLIRLPVASADGKSQVNGADGLISIENTTPGGEAGMTFVTANDGTRWRANVEEGLAAGQMTFYNAANEPVFTMRQNGDVYLEQGGPNNLGGIAATEDFVRTLMNTFPLIDDGNNTQSSWARIDTDSDGPNMKEIYFGIGGQSVQNPDRILTISIDTSADENSLRKHITAHNDYTPSNPQDLVTLSYMQANGASGNLPISSEDGTVVLSDSSGNFVVSTGGSPRLTVTTTDIKASDGYEPQTDDSLVTRGWVNANGGTLPIYSSNAKARVDYLDFYDDPDKWSLVRLVNTVNTDGYDEPQVASSLQMDGLGRIVIQASASGSAQPLTSTAVATYAITTSGSSSRIGYSNRSKHYGDQDNLNADSGMEDVSLTYGYYSQSQFKDITVVTAVDFNACGPQPINNSASNTCIGFYCQSNFASDIEHPLSGPPTKMGFRSDINQETNKKQYAIYVNGTAPSRFNSNIQLTSNCAITTEADTDAKLTISGTQAQVESTGYSPLRVKNLASNGACITSESAYGSYSFGTTGLGWSVIDSDNNYVCAIQADAKYFYKTDGQTYALFISDNAIRADADYEPSDVADLVTKKYCDDEISQAIASGGGDTTVVAGTPTGNTEPDAAPGSMMFDETFMYLKTNNWWRKIPLYALSDASAVGRVTVQMTQAQYQALETKDPNTLYVIVG